MNFRGIIAAGGGGGYAHTRKKTTSLHYDLFKFKNNQKFFRVSLNMPKRKNCYL